MDDSVFNISDIFYSIQGESTFAGLPCCFIRLAGCNLRCDYCDSSYTWDEKPIKKTSNEIIAWLKDYPEAIVELTGGEPLIQDNIYCLLKRLKKSNRTVLLETNGTLSIEKVPREIIIIMDIKCPGSKMNNLVHWQNIDILKNRKLHGSHDEIKFVLSSEEDFHWARKKISQYGLNKITPVIFSPVRKTFAATDLAQLILKHNIPVRLQLQLHTILWPNITRGV